MEIGEPKDGMNLDSLQLSQGLAGNHKNPGELEKKMRYRGRKGFIWVKRSDFPDVLVKAYYYSRARGD